MEATNVFAILIGFVQQLVAAMLDIGSDLIAWMFQQGNEIVLLGVAMFVLVAIVSGVRRFIPGL